MEEIVLAGFVDALRKVAQMGGIDQGPPRMMRPGRQLSQSLFPGGFGGNRLARSGSGAPAPSSPRFSAIDAMRQARGSRVVPPVTSSIFSPQKPGQPFGRLTRLGQGRM